MALQPRFREYCEIFRDEDVPQTITEEIRGKVYTLDYVHTRVVSVLSANQGNRVFHVYGNPNVSDPQKDAFIVIDAQTQQIVEWGDCAILIDGGGYHFDGNDPENVAKTEVLTRTYLEELIGKELADQYEFVYSSQNFEFVRLINEKKSHERVYMRLDVEGTLVRYGLCNVGRCESMTEFAFDEVKAMENVRKAIGELYPNGIEYARVMDVSVQKIPSGQMAYVYFMEVDTIGFGTHIRRFVVAAE